MPEDNGDPYNPTSAAYVGKSHEEAEAREEVLLESAQRYAHLRNEGVIDCECGGRIELDRGHSDTRHEPGVPPCWHCVACGLNWNYHPAIERAYLTGARFVEGGYEIGVRSEPDKPAVTRACPKCGSFATSIPPGDNGGGCLWCGHTWSQAERKDR